MRKTFRKIHLWLAVPFGLIITIICFTGALLVFEDEITHLTNRNLYYVENPGSQPLPVGTLVEKVESQLVKGGAITGVTIYPQPNRTYQVNLSSPRGAAVYIDPYTGEIKGQSQRSPFYQAVFSLHRWLLDSQPADGGIFWGKRITGISTLLFVIILLSGIVIWWPRSRKGLKNGIQIALRKGKARFWHDLHAAGGIYVLLLILVMALTGLTWSFDWYKNAFYTVFGVETSAAAKPAANSPAQGQKVSQGKSPVTKDTPAAQPSPFACWQSVYDQLAARNPGNQKIEISNGTANVSNNRYGNIRGTDRYTFDPQSGQITGVSLYKESNSSGKIRGWIYSIHTGAWGGTASRILWVLASLLGATLPLTGYYLWIKRLYRKRHNRATTR
ncbi:PepSY-associated TM helix domain-containing protein [Barnesiella sp. An55]|uniref:PepSY-associated TM helix domain-containing protein n=1 Tax=Barnesiella sp. An55 TaxID=1965646 RepID=UPI000B37A1E4|nr:PepSY-associated TM helix domain-containing protein [Barnesiella sp. An55]OUN72453.1 iron transporter [Barnesiella sp. An55]HIZ25678.1 PepSY domain-containing protein [Candidatus Barnesiella merdipullorum]